MKKSIGNTQKPNVVLAICYDFDKTLSPDDMQSQGYIQSLGYNVNDFWQESNRLAADNDMDQNLAYMFMMSQKSRGKTLFTRDNLKEAGSKVQLFPGVKTWFERINSYGREKGVTIEHYIISSGLKEMIEGTEIANEFTKIYASSFYYDDTNVAVWPAQAVNYTNKTQFLFRIKKGVLDINDQNVNSYFEHNEYRVPFRNMIYIGDSDTDIPCMKLVNLNGGHSIGVYNSDTQDKSKVFRMLDDNRIKYYVPADYTENSELEVLIKRIVDRTSFNEILEHKHYMCVTEKNEETKNLSIEDKNKENLINNLEDSTSFSYTHDIISKLSKIDDWSNDQKRKLCRIAFENKQVRYILTDKDVKEFYERICQEMEDAIANQIKKLLNS